MAAAVCKTWFSALGIIMQARLMRGGTLARRTSRCAVQPPLQRRLLSPLQPPPPQAVLILKRDFCTHMQRLECARRAVLIGHVSSFSPY